MESSRHTTRVARRIPLHQKTVRNFKAVDLDEEYRTYSQLFTELTNLSNHLSQFKEILADREIKAESKLDVQVKKILAEEATINENRTALQTFKTKLDSLKQDTRDRCLAAFIKPLEVICKSIKSGSEEEKQLQSQFEGVMQIDFKESKITPISLSSDKINDIEIKKINTCLRFISQHHSYILQEFDDDGFAEKISVFTLLSRQLSSKFSLDELAEIFDTEHGIVSLTEEAFTYHPSKREQYKQELDSIYQQIELTKEVLGTIPSVQPDIERIEKTYKRKSSGSLSSTPFTLLAAKTSIDKKQDSKHSPEAIIVLLRDKLISKNAKGDLRYEFSLRFFSRKYVCKSIFRAKANKTPSTMQAIIDLIQATQPSDALEKLKQLSKLEELLKKLRGKMRGVKPRTRLYKALQENLAQDSNGNFIKSFDEMHASLNAFFDQFADAYALKGAKPRLSF